MQANTGFDRSLTAIRRRNDRDHLAWQGQLRIGIETHVGRHADAHPADVRLDIADMAGRKVAGVVRKNCNPGAQSIKLNLSGLGLPPGDYIYELQVTTRHGVFCQSKLMTTK